MAADASSSTAHSFQHRFHQRWPTLRHPHVRALAWLLDAPNLLDAAYARWQGKIASLPATAADEIRAWLLQLDDSPIELENFLGVHRFTRLGRYAENLLAWYFEHQGLLVAHGLQVRAGKEDTVGEFDFLLKQGDALVHWEFATKFYLLYSDDPALAAVQQADYFIGPNLADTLGRKIRKILDRQLLLGEHPAAQTLLPQALSGAQALVKGWLFYRRGEVPDLQKVGVSSQHCHGWWCTLQELGTHISEAGAMIPRIAWMAPARLPLSEGLRLQELESALVGQFAADSMPVMVAVLERIGDEWIEMDRGFVVPDDWTQTAKQRFSG